MRESRSQTRGKASARTSSPSPEPVRVLRSASPTRGKRRGSAAGVSKSPGPSQKTKNMVKSEKNAHYEFGGPIGAVGIIVGLPAVCYLLVLACNPAGYLTLSKGLPPPPSGPFVSVFGFAAYLGWIAICAALHLVLPGARVPGTALANGGQLDYKMNGLLVAAIALAVGLAALTWGGLAELVHEHFLALLSAAVTVSLALSAWLYVRSFRRPAPLLAAGGDTGNALYDFFIGRELNPRVGGGAFDLKQWCELVPGLSLWLLLDCAFAVAEWRRDGQPSAAMMLVLLFHAIYVVDAVANEPAILTTMDITTDGFGFMLAFGDLVWVPFTYCLQARFIFEHGSQLSALHVVVICALQAAGYAIFRGANSQKDAFRRDPKAKEVAHIRYIDTARGTRLMVSGWWGVARHINYTGDLLMALAWCLPCGFRSPVPYFYITYFAALLVHREGRDEHACRLKYGKDWDRYCALVRYRFVPGIY